MMIVGWKAIAAKAGFHQRTIKRWHYERTPLEFDKTTPNKQGKVMITEEALRQWLKSLRSATIPRR